MAPSLLHGAAITLSLAAAVRGGPLQPPNFDLNGFSIIRTPTGGIPVLPNLPSSSTTTTTSQATPAPSSSAAPSSGNSTGPGCPAEKYFHPTRQQWSEAKTDDWLNNWWESNNGTFNNKGGFASSLGTEYLRQPDFACSQVSSSVDCTFDPCSINAPPNAVDTDVRSPYYVLESIRRFHGYFSSMAETLQSSGIGAALNNDQWGYTFYRDKDDKDMTLFKEIANALIVVIALCAAMAGPIGVGIAGAAVGATVAGFAGGASILFSGTSFGFILKIPNHTINTPEKAAGVGKYLGSLFMGTMQNFLQANAALMKGDAYGDTGDIRRYINGGKWVDYPGLNESSVLNTWNNMLTSAAINQLYRLQKVFIVGGGPCDDSGVIGKGPEEAKFCRDGKSWYLYYWNEPKSSIVFGKGQWGHVDKPPGFDEFGKGIYADITPQVIINSSINAFFAAGGNNYTSKFAQTRAQSALDEGWSDPISAGLHWEGIFNIPVCDVSGVVPQKDWKKKDVIQQPYGNKKILTWCGPVCGQSQNETDTFIEMANMKNFKSIHQYCP